MKQFKLSMPINALFVAALSLTALQFQWGFPVSKAQAPPFVPPKANPAAVQAPGNSRAPMQPSSGGAPPISGNVYQNQADMMQAAGPENVMIILDSSDSMADSVASSRESKMSAAKRTVLEVVRNIPPSTRVGLRIYGDSANPFNACHATSVLVPMGENNRSLIASKMIGVKPTGMTPISYTVLRSLEEDFRLVQGRKSIILISDGIETCGEDPCRVAVRMQQMGINVKINVIGFGLNDYAATKQLRCVALGTKGQFYSANTAAELAHSLNKALAVETKVQGTILTPMSPVTSTGTSSMTVPAEEAPANTNNPPEYQDKELPAAVPMKPIKR